MAIEDKEFYNHLTNIKEIIGDIHKDLATLREQNVATKQSIESTMSMLNVNLQSTFSKLTDKMSLELNKTKGYIDKKIQYEVNLINEKTHKELIGYVSETHCELKESAMNLKIEKKLENYPTREELMRYLKIVTAIIATLYALVDKALPYLIK